MALLDQVGKVAVDEINSTTLPEAAKIISDTLAQVAVVANGLLNGLEGERLLATQGLEDAVKPLLAPVIEQWSRTNDELTKINHFLARVRLVDN